MTPESIENLFQSIDTIVNARIANLPFDQTIECEVIKLEEDNKYLIKYQASTFPAYSKGEVYSPGDIVYVQVPQGDFTQDKFIISKRSLVEKNTTKKMPFLSFVKNTNVLRASISEREYYVQTSSNWAESNVSTMEVKNFYGETKAAGYTRIGLKFAVKAGITEELISGEYGVRLILKGYDQSKTYLPWDAAITSPILETRTYNFSMKEMVGSSVYNTLGYNNQEKVYDITNFVVTSAQVQFYQNGKFLKLESSRSSDYDLNTKHQLIETIENISKNIAAIDESQFKTYEEYSEKVNELIKTQKEYLALISMQSATKNKIYFTNVQLFFGYDSSDFYNNEYRAYLYTPDGLYYNNEWYTKKIKIRFVQTQNNKQDLSILDTAVAGSNKYTVFWEMYDSSVTEISKISGLQSYKRIDIEGIETDYSLSIAKNKLSQSFIVMIQDTTNGKKYFSNKLIFTSSSTLSTEDLLDVLSSSEYFLIDKNGKVFLNGGINGRTLDGGASISNAYITNSTLYNVELTGINTGTIQNARNCTSDGNIYTNFQRIKTAIENLGGSYTIA